MCCPRRGAASVNHRICFRRSSNPGAGNRWQVYLEREHVNGGTLTIKWEAACTGGRLRGMH
ncbi:hypothetical protein GEV33_002596 [Tenebrio molitor]|uniref:Uncharacterized protein n=1 Tax=Tenebrio molitor TaxID=7067 RepID=A0A8J6HK26_TENMO|nr:hypothetical protein GEV33_002596 [Tenebrio molitor]